ncbi:uncharacterized protein MYCFIDRAFT_206720 [Pseudocercospora fijiensis CIRAD86]|uniref:Uncharacterized protein n=1 Tax=Pseudocercospora fijiensis (strain CIRAD86) TaxID=383855 RepID=M3B9Y7_PSEFD|nr:uncharacterized protein MYCFIDRAFT_206720 [Pseudocercospora fijiensis CIRAD86]EME86142.1 hypothetical protein MYCFIDRAFT_206720 [Pseudocercospora fijiensis CIRAD86]
MQAVVIDTNGTTDRPLGHNTALNLIKDSAAPKLTSKHLLAMDPEGAPALAPKKELKRKHSDASIQPLFGKQVKTVSGTTFDPINVDIYRLRKEHDLEWDRIAEDLNTRYNRGVTWALISALNNTNGGIPSKYAAAIAQSRGEDYRREWYIADAHNKASLAVDNHALNKAIYLMCTKESKNTGLTGPEAGSRYQQYDSVHHTKGFSTDSSVEYVLPAIQEYWSIHSPLAFDEKSQKRRTAEKAPAIQPAQPAPTNQRKPSMTNLPRIKTPVIKKEPINDPERPAPKLRGRADSEVKVVASRPAPDRRQSSAVDFLKPTIPSKPKSERSVAGGVPKSASSSSSSSKTGKNERVSKTTSSAHDADGLVKEAYSKVKARVWKEVSELVAFASKGEVMMTDEECQLVVSRIDDEGKRAACRRQNHGTFYVTWSCHRARAQAFWYMYHSYSIYNPSQANQAPSISLIQPNNLSHKLQPFWYPSSIDRKLSLPPVTPS